MKEKTIVLTGKAYLDLKRQLDKNKSHDLSIGTEENPQKVRVVEAIVDSDPDFAIDKEEYPQIGEGTEIQVHIKYEE